MPEIAWAIQERDHKGPDSDTKDGHLIVNSLRSRHSTPNEGDAKVVTGQRVRRLTPLESERLMGLPDNWTLVPYRGAPATPSPRFKAIGNSMAVNVIRWIGQRIQQVERI